MISRMNLYKKIKPIRERNQTSFELRKYLSNLLTQMNEEDMKTVYYRYATAIDNSTLPEYNELECNKLI